MAAATEPQDQPAPTKADALVAFASARGAALKLKHDAHRLALPDMAGLKPADAFALFADVDAAAKAADAAAKRLKEIREDLNDPTLAALDQVGLQRAPLQGGPTIYRARELWAGNDSEEGEDTDAAYERACAALERVGDLAPYVQRRYNVQSLSAYFRERERALEAEARERDGLPDDAPVAIDPADLLPPELAGAIRLTEKVSARAVTS